MSIDGYDEVVARALGTRGIVCTLSEAMGRTIHDANQVLFKERENSPVMPKVEADYDMLHDRLMDDAVDAVVAIRLLAEKFEIPFEGILIAADEHIKDVALEVNKAVDRINGIE